MPKKAEFISEIKGIFTNARNKGDKYVGIISKDLHTKLGGYKNQLGYVSNTVLISIIIHH